MTPVRQICARAFPLMRQHIDTDQILPARFMKTMSRRGLGRQLFHDLRFDENGAPRASSGLTGLLPGQAQILIAGDNFGCGSSREHAVWALTDFGIRCVIAPSFGDIFSSNCTKNGLLLVCLSPQICRTLADQAQQSDAPITVDLESQMVTDSMGNIIPFHIGASDRNALLNGLDQIERTLVHADAIAQYEIGKPAPKLR